jgi:transposase
MPKSKVRYVGLDVHKDSIVIAVAEQGRSSARDVGKFPSDWESLRKQLEKLAKGFRLNLCYEAGPTGFELQRRLVEAGYDSQVIAPSLIPTKPGDRIKTDTRDAAKLATCLRAGDLTAVYVPDVETEALRDLERARTAAKEAQTACKHQLGKFLLRHGRRWEGGSNWTLKHMVWVRQQAFDHEAQRRVLRDYIKAVDDATERVDRLTQDITELIEVSTLAPLVTALQSMRGIATISSVVIAAEIGDLRRFDKPGAFMSYLGLVPSEHSSGKRTQRGSITKTGNKHVRRILIEAAWHYWKPAVMSRALRARNALVSDEVSKVAWKAQKRLHRKFEHLVFEKGKAPQVAVVAVARELAGFLWAIAQEDQWLAA